MYSEDQVRGFIKDELLNHKTHVEKTVKKWGSIGSAAISLLLLLGFTVGDLADKARETFIPQTYIVSQLFDFGEVPEARRNIEGLVWKTLETNDIDKLERLFANSKLDEMIIDTYQAQINDMLFSTKVSDKGFRTKTIMQLGAKKQTVLIGEYRNPNNSLTNCGKIFRQNKRRVILYIPNAGTIEPPLPWLECPKSYPSIIIELWIEDVVVGGVLIVGVERPIDSNNIVGTRARVTGAVAEEFKNKGIDLGKHITSGYMRITDVF